jgi:hypothetical protein
MVLFCLENVNCPVHPPLTMGCAMFIWAHGAHLALRLLSHEIL